LNQAEYQRRRRQLDDELRAGIEMLQEGHRTKVERLDRLWLEAGEEAPASPPVLPEAPPPAPVPPEPSPLRERREAGALRDDVEAALTAVGDEFEKRDLYRALGYRPKRTSLYRVLWDLQGEGLIELLDPGRGGRATRYRKGSRSAED
jgi:hypothetical protein